MFSRKELKNISTNTGIYIFSNHKKEIIYVGKALRLRERIRSYFSPQTSTKNSLLVNEVSFYETIAVASEVEALILEANLIKKYLPKYNISLRDDKSFLYIAITKEEFPRVLPYRKSDQLQVKCLYGPYPSSQTARNVLKLLRRVFHFCTQSPKVKKACFYSHIGLCHPCPAVIRKEKGEKYQILRKTYLKNILNIKHFLEGKLTFLNTSLTKEMKKYSDNKQFEKAQEIYNQIQGLNYIIRPYYKISSFLENPNFLEEQKQKAGGELLTLLKPYYPKLKVIRRLEGIDISNISGKESTGSLVVFIEGEKQKSSYKRFKIKSKGPNDVVMIAEVLERRLKHKEWDYPDLLIIDGGKPQVSYAKKVLEKYSNIPVIGLAKRNETIIVPNNNDFKSISLKRNSPSLRLIQEVRDEAHRFAKSYHRLLRKRVLIKGLSP